MKGFKVLKILNTITNRLVRKLLLAIAPFVFSFTNNAIAQERTLYFSGFEWVVRGDGTGNPGNNVWSSRNAWVDQNGALHLLLSYRNGQWYSSEVFTKARLGFGVYQFKIDSRLDLFDKNVVFGMFHYPTSDVGPDRTHELDIEIAKWGNQNANILNYNAWPVSPSLEPTGSNHPMFLQGTQTTHRYIWNYNFVRYESTHTFSDYNPFPIASSVFAPPDFYNRIAQKPMPMHLNLWTYGPPQTTRDVEVIVREFKFIPFR
jgi:hypothetical protein